MEALLDVSRDRFRLRAAEPSDLAAILEHGDHPDSLWLGVPHPCSVERAEQVLSEFAQEWAGSFGLARLVVDLDSDEILGLVSLIRHSETCVEVSYGVAPMQRGRGIATKVLSLVAEHVLHPDGLLDRIEAVIEPSNTASIRVASKVGFIYEGIRRSVVPGTGQEFADCVYALTRE